MTRVSLALVSAVLVLAALPVLPSAQAQAGGPAPLVIVYQDAFTAGDGNGWQTTSASTTPAEGDSWFRITDGDKADSPTVWYAARTTAQNQPAGYSNNADVRLISPVVSIPTGFFARSVAITLRGSSEAYDGEIGDYLTLQWAPTSTTPDAEWETLHTWSGIDEDLQASYALEQYTSARFLNSREMVFRLRFVSDTNCDSNPGDVGPTVIAPATPPMPDGSEITPPGTGPMPDPNAITPPGVDPIPPDGPEDVTPPGYTGPTPSPTPPGVNYPPEGYDPMSTDPGYDLGETEDSVNCMETYQGWFIDDFTVIGRRDFTAAAANAPRVALQATDTGLTVDLLADMGKLIDFKLDPAHVTVPSDTNAVVVRLDRQNSADLFTLAALRGDDGVWSAPLAVDEPDLIAGVWDVTFFASTPGGGSSVATNVLTVRAQDQAVPRLTAAPVGNPIPLGPGGGITLDVQEAFLRRVTYTFPGMPTPVDLAFPYIVPVAAFPEGPSKVTFRAEDRSGHVASLDVNVERDTIRPALQVLGPATVYTGVPFDLSLSVVERSAHTIRVDIGGTVIDLTGKAGDAAAGKSTVLQVTPPEVGDLTIAATVVDALGNEAVAVREFVAVLPVTDLRVNTVRLASPATNTSSEGQSIVAVVEQVGGVAPLPVTVTFEAAGRSQAYTVTVPAAGPFEVRWDVKLPPGLQTVKVHAAGPAIANETLPGNENGTMTVESFLGRVTIGSKVYTIRSDARGLPTTAVQAGTGKTYPLALVNAGSGVAYQFSADGNRTVVWDPLKPVMELEAASTSSPTAGGKDAPFPGLLMAIAVLALAALAQRRKA